MRINEHKIKRYQAGGFMVYQPLPLQPPSAPVEEPYDTSSGNVKTPEEIIDNKLVEKLLGNGITNDVMSFKNDIDRAYSEYANMSDIQKQTAYGRNLRNIMKGDFSIINRLMRSKDNFTNAIRQAENKESLGDIAITNSGMLVKDMETGKILEVTHENYLKELRDNSQYKPITNAELINEREYNPLLTNDPRSIEVLNNSIGTNKVKEEIVKILSDIGSEKSTIAKENYIYYGAQTPEQLQKAASELIGMGQEGFYKINKKQSSESNERHLIAAREAMWMNLSPQARSLLKAKAAMEGSSNIEESAKEYAIALLNVNLKTSNTEETTITLDDQMTKNKGGAGSENALNDEIKFWQQLVSGASDMTKMVVDLGSGNTTEAYGYSPGVMQSDGKIVGPTSLRNIKELPGAVSKNNASIGGNKIPVDQWDAIIYQGNEVIKVTFPSKRGPGNTILPDFDRAESFNKLKKELDSVPTAAAREELITRSGFMSDGRGNISKGEFTDFIVFDGMINEDALGGISDKRLLEEANENEKDFYKDLYLKNSTDSSSEFEASGTTGFGWTQDNIFFSNDVYKGRVFIALEENRYATSRNLDGQGLNVTKSMNTPYYLGNAKALVNENKRNNTLYSLEDGK